MAVVEQILLWNFCARWFFWLALILNISGVLALGWSISKLDNVLIPLKKSKL